MTDAYYQLLDADDRRGERFAASDHVISTWGSSMQNAAPVSALLVRAIEQCAARPDTRISRVVVDLLGPVPVGDQLWVRAEVRRLDGAPVVNPLEGVPGLAMVAMTNPVFLGSAPGS